MRTEKVNFYSEGDKLVGDLYLPDSDQGKPFPGIVQGPGFLGLKDAKHYIMMFEKLCAAGYACLCFDYRGWGESEGKQRGWVMPQWQVEDIRNAITYMQTRPDIDPDRIATYGSGGTGGGNAVYVAAIDSRVKCCVSYLGVSSGRDWLHCMRREYEWVDYLKMIEEDRKKRVTTGSGAIVSAREGGIMVQTPERQTTTIKKDVRRGDPGVQPHRCGPQDLAARGLVHRRRRRRGDPGAAVFRSLRKSRRAEKIGPLPQNHPLRHLQRLLRGRRRQRRRLVQPALEVPQGGSDREEIKLPQRRNDRHVFSWRLGERKS